MTFTSSEHLDAYRGEHTPPFSLLRDPDRSAYRSFGLGRGSVRRVWGVRAARRYVELLTRRRAAGSWWVRRPTEDTLQLGGDFVIGPDGTLVYAFWGEGPDDRPPVDEIIAATRSTA